MIQSLILKGEYNMSNLKLLITIALVGHSEQLQNIYDKYNLLLRTEVQGKGKSVSSVGAGGQLVCSLARIPQGCRYFPQPQQHRGNESGMEELVL